MTISRITPPTRFVAGTQLPAAGRWTIDPGHAEVAFIGRHFMLTKVRGRFSKISGAFEIGDDPSESSVEVTIDMNSVESGSRDRDDHLRSSDFFDVANFPEATFRSTSLTWSGAEATIEGELTIVGITRPVSLDVVYVGSVGDPWGGQRAVFSASTEVNREDWGLTWNVALEAGGVLVSKKIRIEIELEAVRD
jgi:polyisoprenoid-binding protein YceI